MWLFFSLDSFDSCSFVNDTQALCEWHCQSPSQRGGKKLHTLGWGKEATLAPFWDSADKLCYVGFFAVAG
jgi:hypothetical protein